MSDEARDFMQAPTPLHEVRSALAEPGFTSFLIVRLLTGLAVQIQTVAIGWWIYDRTRDPFDLGLVGLTQFLPALLLVLVSGAASDRFGRNRIVCMSLGVMALSAIALLFFTMSGQAPVWSVFAVLMCFGTARAFYSPAQQALLPNLVSVKNLAGGIAISSFVLKTATVLGPVAGGLLYSISAPAPFAVTIGLLVGGATAAFFIPPFAKAAMVEEPTWSHLLGGFRYVWSDKLILGALSLDMFAVLLGGATALMPVYARDILQVGPFGLGVLNASPAVGAIVLGIYMSIRPIRNRAGLVMLLSVAVFGIATIVFGLSRSFELSVAALIVMGAGDMVSVNLRQTLVQLWTPDHLRGRVSAINTVFIGASNEIGEFRAGISAALIGTISAVVVGGLGTLAVVGLWTRVFPELLAVKKLGAERIPAPD